MYSDPCARFIMSITPNTSVSPAASRNSISPNCRPLSNCSAMRVAVMGGRLQASARRTNGPTAGAVSPGAAGSARRRRAYFIVHWLA